MDGWRLQGDRNCRAQRAEGSARETEAADESVLGRRAFVERRLREVERQGCIPTAVMVDQALEGRAEDTRTFAGGPDEVYSATLAALRQLGVEVLKSFQDNVGADIDGTWPTGERLDVRLEQSGERQTVVRAQLGRRRNPEATGQLFNAIAGKLHSRP